MALQQYNSMIVKAPYLVAAIPFAPMLDLLPKIQSVPASYYFPVPKVPFQSFPLSRNNSISLLFCCFAYPSLLGTTQVKLPLQTLYQQSMDATHPTKATPISCQQYIQLLNLLLQCASTAPDSASTLLSRSQSYLQDICQYLLQPEILHILNADQILSVINVGNLVRTSVNSAKLLLLSILSREDAVKMIPSDVLLRSSKYLGNLDYLPNNFRGHLLNLTLTAPIACRLLRHCCSSTDIPMSQFIASYALDQLKKGYKQLELTNIEDLFKGIDELQRCSNENDDIIQSLPSFLIKVSMQVTKTLNYLDSTQFLTVVGIYMRYLKSFSRANMNAYSNNSEAFAEFWNIKSQFFTTLTNMTIDKCSCFDFVQISNFLDSISHFNEGELQQNNSHVSTRNSEQFDLQNDFYAQHFNEFVFTFLSKALVTPELTHEQCFEMCREKMRNCSVSDLLNILYHLCQCSLQESSEFIFIYNATAKMLEKNKQQFRINRLHELCVICETIDDSQSFLACLTSFLNNKYNLKRLRTDALIDVIISLSKLKKTESNLLSLVVTALEKRLRIEKSIPLGTVSTLFSILLNMNESKEIVDGKFEKINNISEKTRDLLQQVFRIITPNLSAYFYTDVFNFFKTISQFSYFGQIVAVEQSLHPFSPISLFPDIFVNFIKNNCHNMNPQNLCDSWVLLSSFEKFDLTCIPSLLDKSMQHLNYLNQEQIARIIECLSKLRILHHFVLKNFIERFLNNFDGGTEEAANTTAVQACRIFRAADELSYMDMEVGNFSNIFHNVPNLNLKFKIEFLNLLARHRYFDSSFKTDFENIVQLASANPSSLSSADLQRLYELFLNCLLDGPDHAQPASYIVEEHFSRLGRCSQAWFSLQQKIMDDFIETSDYTEIRDMLVKIELSHLLPQIADFDFCHFATPSSLRTSIHSAPVALLSIQPEQEMRWWNSCTSKNYDFSNHMKQNSEKYTGLINQQIRRLQRLGWEVFTISLLQLHLFKTPSEKLNYIRKCTQQPKFTKDTQ